jgi:hypothetical protein
MRKHFLSRSTRVVTSGQTVIHHSFALALCNFMDVKSFKLHVGCMLQIWMLTGDKLETATCIAKSSRLVSRTQGLHVFKSVVTRTDAHLELNTFRKKQDCALVISGDSLEVSECKQG